jgi:hypothetical protein
MTVSDAVMNDLLTVYLAGEASAETKAMVEEYARGHPSYAARLHQAASLPNPDSLRMPAPPPDQHLQTLQRTREFLRLRTIFTAGGILFTLLPLVFTFGDGGVQFLILGRHPGLLWACWSLAAASWAARYVMHRQVRLTGV